MKHFKTPANHIYAFESDGSQDDLIAADMTPISDAELAVLRAPPPLTPEQVTAKFTGAIQVRLDAFAETRNYDGILSACTYATSTVPKFAAEGQYCVQARDLTWAAAYAILAAVQGGTRLMPTVAEVLAEMPTLAWPA